MNYNIIDVNVNNIKIGKRIRKDMGDLEPLARIIEETGLLRPIGITTDYELVFGERCLLAVRDILKRQTISARIVQVKSILCGQIEENLIQKTYTPSERVAIVDALRSFTHGGDRKSDQARKCEVEKLTVDQAAQRVGLGGKDGYLRAKGVVQSGIPELIAAMDSRKLSIAAAAEIAKLPPEDQKESVRRGRKAMAREPNDFYPTPTYVTEALLQVEEFGRQVWEPACGDGAMAEVIGAAGYEVVSSDLIDRGYGEVQDFLTSHRTVESIVTNPPFKQDEEFVRKALASTTYKVAMFLPLAFLEGTKRVEWMRTSPLKSVYVFASRVTFNKSGVARREHGRYVFAWFVWEHGYFGLPTLSWIEAKKEKELPVARSSGDRSLFVPAVETVPLPPPEINTVLQGDCRDLTPLLPDNSINLCLCSPPYAQQRDKHYPGVPEEAYPKFTAEWMERLVPKLTDDASVLIVIRPHLKHGVISDYVLKTRLLLRQMGWRECEELIWHKTDGGACMGSLKRPRRTYESILWFSRTHEPFSDVKACGKWSDNVSFRGSTRFGIGGNSLVHGGQDKTKRSGRTRLTDVISVPVTAIPRGIEHPAMFPVELADTLIQTFCPPGGTVLDNFAGSGSTLIAAKRLGRDFCGMEIVPKFCEIARSRLAETTTQLPKAG